MKELKNILTMYAISPIHAGAESSTGVVDNPIQREKHTGYPHIQANGVKGAMRAHFRKTEHRYETINFIFGTDNGNDGDQKNHKEEKNGKKERVSMAGAIAVSDAKLFAMPVRSNIAPFVMVTCPAILKRLKTDLEIAELEGLSEITPVTGDSSILLNWDTPEETIILEDAVVNKGSRADLEDIKTFFPEAEKLLLISDDMFKYVSENCTEVQTQIKIDAEKGTAEQGGLRYEELLPSDSILYSVVMYDTAAFANKVEDEMKAKLQAQTIKDKVEQTFNSFMQIGGDATLGRGMVKLGWMQGGAQ